MPRQSNAKQQLVHAAADLFRHQGYDGTGLTEILSRSGAPKGSFYHHFPGGKEALAEAAVIEAGAEITDGLRQMLADAPDFESGISAVADAIGDWFAGSDFSRGCPVTSVLLATVPGSQALRHACAAIFGDWAGVVGEAAAGDGLADHGPALGQAAVVAIEGAWIVARTNRTTQPFSLAASMIVALARQFRAAPAQSGQRSPTDPKGAVR